MATQRGLFIVLEGPDGAGISTQTELLTSGLAARGLKALATKEPSTGPIGSVIRQALAHRLVYPPNEPVGNEVMALLFAADRLDHIRADIVPRLEAGVHVVCDRYRLSSYAYQGLTAGQEWVRTLNSRSIAPDLTIFIDVPPEVSQARIASRGGYVELYEADERLRPIYANYLSLVEEAKQAGERIVVVNGTPSVEVVADAILQQVLHMIESTPEPAPPATGEGGSASKPRYTFHYTPVDYFNSLDPDQDYTPPNFARDGFIHTTDRSENMLQVANTRYRDDPRDFWVLYIDKSLVKSPIRYDDPGEIYPHIYGPLNRDAIVHKRLALRNADGTFLTMPEMDEDLFSNPAR